MMRALLPWRFLSCVAVLLAATSGGMACTDNLTYPTRDPYSSAMPDPLDCVPNLDGRIDGNELAPTLGVPASFLVSPDGEERPVDLVGSVDAGGALVWDWSVDLASDQEADLMAEPLAGRWYVDSFPTGEFVAPFDASGSTEAVYMHDDNALWLLGLASAEPAPPGGQTLLVYEAPVALYRFPVETGASWTSVGTISNGTFYGLPYAAEDTYEVSVVATGELRLPDMTFTQAHQLRLSVTLDPALGPTVFLREASFLFECFGEVARATSRPDETEAAFTVAAETRRLGL